MKDGSVQTAGSAGHQGEGSASTTVSNAEFLGGFSGGARRERVLSLPRASVAKGVREGGRGQGHRFGAKLICI